jgi:hypothetical protein
MVERGVSVEVDIVSSGNTKQERDVYIYMICDVLEVDNVKQQRLSYQARGEGEVVTRHEAGSKNGNRREIKVS